MAGKQESQSEAPTQLIPSYNECFMATVVEDSQEVDNFGEHKLPPQVAGEVK